MGVGGLAQLLSGMWEVSSRPLFGLKGDDQVDASASSDSCSRRLLILLLRLPSSPLEIPLEPLLSARESLSQSIYRQRSWKADFPSRLFSSQLRNFLALFRSHLLAQLRFVALRLLVFVLANPFVHPGILTADYAKGELESALGIYLMSWFVPSPQLY